MFACIQCPKMLHNEMLSDATKYAHSSELTVVQHEYTIETAIE